MKEIVCTNCINKKICKYSETAIELANEISPIIDDKISKEAPVIFGLSVTCSRFSRGSVGFR